MKTLWNIWKQIAKTIGTFQARVILSFFYFIIIVPIGLVYKLTLTALSKKTNWTVKDATGYSSLEEMRLQ